MNRVRKTLRDALARLWQFHRAYLAVNVLYFGLVAVGAACGALNPQLTATLAKSGRENVSSALPMVASAYKNGHVLSAIGWTFAINFLGGSLLSIAIPSLIVPFSGLLLALGRAFVWGVIFSNSICHPFAAHSAGNLLLLLLEGEGYVLTMLAAYVQSRSFLLGAGDPANTLGERYRQGLRLSLPIYLLVILQLAIAAAYEALLVIVFLPMLE